MLIEIEIENFKSFADKITFSNLKDVNVLVGQNNSGKSSLLQILNFVRLSILKGDLTWYDKETNFNLGSFDEIIYNNETAKNLTFQFSFKSKIPIEIKESIMSTVHKNFDLNVIRWTISIKKYTDGVYVEKEIFEDNKHNEIFTINYNERSAPSVSFSSLDGNLALNKENQKNGLLNWTASLKNFTGGDDYEVLLKFCRDFIKEQFTNMFFLSIDRLNKEWSAYVSVEPKNVGSSGENTVNLFHYIFSGHRNTYNLINNSIKKNFNLKNIESPLISPIHNGQAEIRLDVEGLVHHPNIINCGGGINQLIPLNILCYYSPQNSILLIEEPELCLHPKAANSQFSSFFDLKKDNKQVFVTTHAITNLYNLIQQGRRKKDARIFFLILNKTKTKIEKKYTLPKDTERYDKDFKKLVTEFLGFTDYPD
jgi:predicted ATPase